MTFPHDFAPESQPFTLLPDGEYELQITDTKESKTKAGDPMVNVTCEVINNPDHNGRKLFYNVSFLPKEKPGSGMSTHFMKAINQPWKGSVEVDCSYWIGEKFKAEVSTREYTKKDGSKATVNDIKSIEAADALPF